MNQALRDHQAQSATPKSGLNAGIGLAETGKQSLLFVLRNTNACIGYSELIPVMGQSAHGEFHIAFGGELDSVTQKIDQNLGQTVAVGFYPSR